MIHHGDLFDVLPTLADASIDACVTDPPYGIGFMGREWDTFKPEKARASKMHAITVGEKGRRDLNPNTRGRRQSPAMSPSQIEYNRSLEGQRGFQEWCERWAGEVFRVLKPGAYIVVCGAPRSFHRMTSGLEDAGFEIRDCLSFLFGQGFPKSLNFGCKCRGNAVSYSHASPQHDVRPLLDADLPPTLDVEDQRGKVLFAGVQEHGASAHGHADSTGVDEGREQSGMAGRELHRAGKGLPDDPNAGASSSASERLCSGTPSDSGANFGASTASGGGSASQGSRSSEQRTGQSASLRFPQSPLGDGASDRDTRCERCGGLTEARGWGTALKPGWEPIILARKPFRDTVADNFIKHGTGALNIDACRIDGPPSAGGSNVGGRALGMMNDDGWQPKNRTIDRSLPDGRWPANVIIDEAAAAMLDEQTGDLGVSAGGRIGNAGGGAVQIVPTGMFKAGDPGFGDSGGASRFYYVAKPSREERDYGCDGLRLRSGAEKTGRREGSAGLKGDPSRDGQTVNPYSNGAKARNFHPTVKPVELMRWLVRLVTPIGGTVLDPFGGSGTTAMACRYEQRKYIIVEREAEYVEIIKRRVSAVAPLFGEIA